jgi:hypothetical protein
MQDLEDGDTEDHDEEDELLDNGDRALQQRRIEDG